MLIFQGVVFSGVSVAVKCKLKIMSLTVSKHLREHITIFERGNPYILRLLYLISLSVEPSTSINFPSSQTKTHLIGLHFVTCKKPTVFFFSPVFCCLAHSFPVWELCGFCSPKSDRNPKGQYIVPLLHFQVHAISFREGIL